jgi:hypothetical protein
MKNFITPPPDRSCESPLTAHQKKGLETWKNGCAMARNPKSKVNIGSTTMKQPDFRNVRESSIRRLPSWINAF